MKLSCEKQWIATLSSEWEGLPAALHLVIVCIGSSYQSLLIYIALAGISTLTSSYKSWSQFIYFLKSNQDILLYPPKIRMFEAQHNIDCGWLQRSCRIQTPTVQTMPCTMGGGNIHVLHILHLILSVFMFQPRLWTNNNEAPSEQW